MSTNVIERVRIRTGLTVPQMLRLLDAKPGRFTLFTSADDTLDPIFVRQALDLERLYNEWEAEVFETINAAAEAHEDGEDAKLSAFDLAQLLKVSEMHLAQLRHRKVLSASTVDGRKHWYTFDSARKLVELNSTLLIEPKKKTRGPLANAFVKWLIANRKLEAAEAALSV